VDADACLIGRFSTKGERIMIMKSGLCAVAVLKTYGFMAASFALVAMVVGVFAAGPAIAQAVRAALVSNVDDPGRIPYSHQANCTWNGSDVCIVDPPPVGAGKRLVITHVSGYVNENLPGGTFILVRVFGGRTSGSAAHLVPTYVGAKDGFNTFVFDQPELLFVDAGQSTTISVNLGAVPSSDSIAIVTLEGYMLDCVNAPCATEAH
jgi:hypothetical protein